MLKNKTKRLVVIEDQTAIREMLVDVLGRDRSYLLVGDSGDGHTAFQFCVDARADVVLLDARLPGANGVDLLRRLLARMPSLRVLVFSGHESPILIREMIEAGAHGFVEKTAGLKDVIRGLDAVAEGGTYFGPGVAALLQASIAGSGAPLQSLTRREREVLQLVAESHSTRRIAARLGISAKTAGNHRTNLMRKLNVHDAAGLTRYALQEGILGPD
jgi:DNA-binding NarL/FixJ family response regulator